MMRNSLLAAVGLFAICTPVVCLAQNGGPLLSEGVGEEGAEIVVTGSLISRSSLDSASPLIVVGADAFQFGDTNVTELLNRMPAFAANRGPTTPNSGFPGSVLDLRGLGATRTLVLVNGRRYPSTLNNGVVDVGTIPPELIDRVDIVTGGASATYGSDAIAGVVNFKLKDRFEGLALSARTGVTGRGEATGQRLALTVGESFADDRGSAFMSLAYDRTNPILSADRSFASPLLNNQGGALVPRLGLPGIDNGAGTVALGPDLLQFDRGELYGPGGIPNAVSPDSLFDEQGFEPILQGSRQISVFGGARFALSPAIELYAEGLFVDQQTRTDGPATVVDLSGAGFNLANPFLGPTTASILAPTADANGNFAFPGFGRRMVEVGSNDTIVDRTTFQIVGGLKIDLFADWKLDTYIQYQQSDFQTNYFNAVDFPALFDGLDTVPGANGPVCRSGSAGCVPVNLFGPGTIGAAAADNLRVNPRLRGNNNGFIVSAIANGTLLNLPAGDVRSAVGVEYRRLAASERPDEALLNGTSTVGQFTVNGTSQRFAEVFGELFIPILKDAPLANSLDFEGGLRATSVISGKTNLTYKALLSWQPVRSIRVRGGLQSAIRQPNVAELSLGDQVQLPNFFPDPCFSGAPLAGTLRAGCLSQGVPLSVADNGADPSSYLLTYRVFGDPNLEPETSRSYTVGVVLDEPGIENLTLTVDFYNIEIKRQILTVGLAALFNGCYISGDAGLCGGIERDPATGFVTLIKDDFRNGGTSLRRGIDFGLNYRIDDLGSFGELQLISNMSLLLKNTVQTVAIDPTTAFECAGFYSEGCALPRPKWSAYTQLGWSKGDVGLQFAWQWIGPTNDRLQEIDPVAASELAVDRIPAVHYFDLAGSVKIGSQMTLAAGLENLFDRAPPIVGADRTGRVSNGYAGMYDFQGRRFFLNVNLQF